MRDRRAADGIAVGRVAAGLCIGAAVVLAASDGRATELDLSYSASQRLTYTDNVDLEPDDDADSALISETALTAEVTATQTGSRFDFAADGTLSLSYSTEDDIDVRQDIQGFGTAEVLEELFFVDFDGSATKRLLDPGDRISADPDSDRDGRRDVYTVGVSPYLVGRIGNWANTEVRYTHESVFVDSDEIDDTSTNAQSALIETGSRFTRVGLSGFAENLSTESRGETGDLDRQTLLVLGSYVVSRQFTLLARGGYDRLQSNDLAEDLKGPRWGVGFRSRPGPRTELEIIYGRRYGDEEDLTASLLYRITPRMTVTASVEDTISTTQGRLDDVLASGQIRLGDLVFDDLIPGGLNNAVARTRTYRADLYGTIERNSYRIRFIAEDRDFDVAADEKVTGVYGRWTRRLARDLSLTAALAYTNTETDGAEGEIATALGSLRLDYDLFSDVILSSFYGHADRFADDADDEYTENLVYVQVRVRF